MVRRLAALAALCCGVGCSSAQAGLNISPETAPADGFEAAKKDSGPARADGSPIGAGLWIWPRAMVTAEEYAKLCRSIVALQLADGRYLGLTYDDGTKFYRVTEAGKCAFDAASNSETCNISFLDQGEKGTIRSAFSRDQNNTLRMSVTGSSAKEGGKPSEIKLEVFPLRCGAEFVWDALQVLPSATPASPR